MIVEILSNTASDTFDGVIDTIYISLIQVPGKFRECLTLLDPC